METQNECHLGAKWIGESNVGKIKEVFDYVSTRIEEIDMKALTLIQLSLSNEVLREVAKEETMLGLWLKLECLYMTKSVTNRLLLKSKLHDLSLRLGIRTLCVTIVKKKGHIKKFWLEKGKNKGKGNGNRSSSYDSAAAVHSGDEDLFCDNCTILLTVEPETRSIDQCILDLGCSRHITLNRHWFSSYESVHGGVVLMGNTASYKVMGIGSIRIKMLDGTVRTLTNVRHVPVMKKNLISLGGLDSNGCRRTLEQGVIRVTLGSQVVMKRKKVGTLYELISSAIEGSTCVSSSIKEADHTT